MQKIIIILSVLGTVIALVSRNSVTLGLCQAPQIDCRIAYDTIEHVLYFFPMLLFVSAFTLVSKDVWTHWWRFAKYAAPVSFVLIVAINFGVLHTNSTGSFGLGDILNQTYDLWSLGLIYIIFTLGSLIQIFRGYRAGKQGSL